MKKALLWLLAWAALTMGSFTFATLGWGFTSQNTAYNPDTLWANSMQNNKLVDMVKSFINWVLGIISVIALIVLLWWGFNMVTAAWDDGKYQKWFKILKQSAMWLVLIWVSWMIISMIFWLLTSIM